MKIRTRATYRRIVDVEPAEAPVAMLPGSNYTWSDPFLVYVTSVTQEVTRDGGPGHECHHSVTVTGDRAKADGTRGKVRSTYTFRGTFGEDAPASVDHLLLSVPDLLAQA